MDIGALSRGKVDDPKGCRDPLTASSVALHDAPQQVGARVTIRACMQAGWQDQRKNSKNDDGAAHPDLHQYIVQGVSRGAEISVVPVSITEHLLGGPVTINHPLTSARA